MSTPVPLAGDADAMGRHGRTADRVAERITNLAVALETLDAESEVASKAVTALQDETRTVAATLRDVQPRYSEAASALLEYAIELAAAQTAAETADREAGARGGDLDRLRQREDLLEQQVDRLRYGAGTPDELRDAVDELTRLRSQISTAEGDLGAARRDYDAAVSRKDDAARRAAERISLAAQTLKDGILDHLGDFLSSALDLLGAVAEWIGSVLVEIIATLADLLGGLWTIIGWLLIGLAIVALLLLAPTWIVLLVAVIGGLVALMLLDIVSRELTQPPPVVKPGQRTPVQEAEGGNPWANEMERNGELDDLGGQLSTEIEVIQAFDENGQPQLDENGNPVFRIVLPSTVDWGHGVFDDPAVNDLGSDAILALFPELQTVYETAIRDALAQAGVPADANLMISGWSLGGIMAAHLASDPTFGYDVGAIFISGAAPELFDIPGSVAVVQVEHNGDPVSPIDNILGLDPGSRPQSADNIHFVADPPIGYPAHNAESYTITAISRVDSSNPDLTPEQRARLIELENLYFGPNERRQVFSATETPGEFDHLTPSPIERLFEH